MYRLRWGIEVMWRGLKQTMGHHKMLGKTPSRAGAELDWAMAGLWMLGAAHERRSIEPPPARAASIVTDRRSASG